MSRPISWMDSHSILNAATTKSTTGWPTVSQAVCKPSQRDANNSPSHSVAVLQASVMPSQNDARAGPTHSTNAETFSPSQVNAPARTLMSTAATLATIWMRGDRIFCTSQLMTLAKTSMTLATICHIQAMARNAPITRKMAPRITPPRMAPTTLRIGNRMGASAWMRFHTAPAISLNASQTAWPIDTKASKTLTMVCQMDEPIDSPAPLRASHTPITASRTVNRMPTMGESSSIPNGMPVKSPRNRMSPTPWTKSHKSLRVSPTLATLLIRVSALSPPIKSHRAP